MFNTGYGNVTTLVTSRFKGLLSTVKICWSPVSGPVPYDNHLTTKEARNGWEVEVSNAIIPQLKVEMFFFSSKRE